MGGFRPRRGCRVGEPVSAYACALVWPSLAGLWLFLHGQLSDYRGGAHGVSPGYNSWPSLWSFHYDWRFGWQFVALGSRQLDTTPGKQSFNGGKLSAPLCGALADVISFSCGVTTAARAAQTGAHDSSPRRYAAAFCLARTRPPVNLPNYFLADLPEGATLTAAMLTEACHTLKRNRRLYLINRTTESMIAILTGLAANWLKPNFPFRKYALEQAPAATGFSKATLEHGLDAFFKELITENFRDLLEQDLGHS